MGHTCLKRVIGVMELGQRTKEPELLNLAQVCVKISINQVIMVIIIITSGDVCPAPRGAGLATEGGHSHCRVVWH